MLKRFKLLSLAAFVIAAALSSCQKQEMESFSNEAVSSDGTRASSFSSKYGIDWGKVTKKYCSSSYPAFYSMQATADKDNVYLLLRAKPGEMKKGHAYDNELSVFVYDKSNGSTRYWNDQKSTRVDAMGGWLMKDSNPKFTSWNDKVSSQAVTYDGYYYYEIRYPRSISSLLKGSSIKIGVRMENNYKRSNGTYASSSDVKVIGILPSKGSDMYSVGSSSSNGNNTPTSTDNNTSTSTHCEEGYLGERPMVQAYLRHDTPASQVIPSKVTHINYYKGVFKNPSTGDGGIVIKSASNLKKVVALKQQNSELKVLLTIGGWGEDGFSEMAKDAKKRTAFCEACKKHIKDYGLDGIDIDWEYPGGGPSGVSKSSSDKSNFNLVLKELRTVLGTKKIISIASSSDPSHIDWKTAMNYVDYVNVMTYDMGKPPYHNSPLYWYDGCALAKDKSHTCQGSVEAFVSAGVPLKKQNLGVPFYGHGKSPYSSDVHFKDLSSALQSTSTKSNYFWDSKAKVPYYGDVNGNLYLSMENKDSVKAKGKFAKEKKMMGVMVWHYGSDDSSHTLMKALYTAVRP